MKRTSREGIMMRYVEATIKRNIKAIPSAAISKLLDEVLSPHHPGELALSKRIQPNHRNAVPCPSIFSRPGRLAVDTTGQADQTFGRRGSSKRKFRPTRRGHPDGHISRQ